MCVFPGSSSHVVLNTVDVFADGISNEISTAYLGEMLTSMFYLNFWCKET